MRSVRPRELDVDDQVVHERERGEPVEPRRRTAAGRAAGAEPSLGARASSTSHSGAPAISPWIGWPYSSACTPGSPDAHVPRDAADDLLRARRAGWPRARAAGCRRSTRARGSRRARAGGRAAPRRRASARRRPSRRPARTPPRPRRRETSVTRSNDGSSGVGTARAGRGSRPFLSSSSRRPGAPTSGPPPSRTARPRLRAVGPESAERQRHR